MKMVCLRERILGGELQWTLPMSEQNIINTSLQIQQWEEGSLGGKYGVLAPTPASRPDQVEFEPEEEKINLRTEECEQW